MGRPAHQPTPESRRYVESAAGLGATQPGIAKILGISVSCLSKHYNDELSRGVEKANLTVAGKLYAQATSDENTQSNTIARIFWLKARARWRESTLIEHSGPDGEPLNANKPPVVVILPDNGRGDNLPPAKPPRMIEGRVVSRE